MQTSLVRRDKEFLLYSNVVEEGSLYSSSVPYIQLVALWQVEVVEYTKALMELIA